MPVSCRNCGAVLPAGAGRCPACLAIVKPPGFFQRLRAALGSIVQVNISRTDTSASEPGLQVNFQTSVKRRYKVLDQKTGQVKEYQSLDEVPAEFRKLIEQAERDAGK